MEVDADRAVTALAELLLERDGELAALSDALARAESGAGGALVLVSGEAGIGKTALLRRFCERREARVRILWGACDALFTPRPLGPFPEVAEGAGVRLRELVARGAKPHELTSALVEELTAGGEPAMLVLEDVHWADEATLDVLRLLARRLETAPALVVATYRDDELDRTHPLRIVVGELGTSASVTRVVLAPLSASAVAALAAGHDLDPDELYRRTAGNPFFVAEVLAAGDDIPHTVRDAVLARLARLSAPAASMVDAAALIPPPIAIPLLEATSGLGREHLDECVAGGMLVAVPHGVAFRHELGRMAVAESLTAFRREALHRAALRALSASGAGRDPGDAARLAYHAEGAGDRAAVLRHAPAAAAHAAAVGAHREAAAQYARALRVSEGLEDSEHARLLEHSAYECYLTGHFDEALAAQEQALTLRRRGDDRSAEADSLRSLSRLYRFVGRVPEAETTGREAVAILEQLPPGEDLAMAYANLSHIGATAEDAALTLEWGERALALAERLDDLDARVYALTNLGTVELNAGQGSGTLERAVALALEAGVEEQAGRALLNLVWWPLIRHRDPRLTRRYLEIGLEHCDERGLDIWRLFLLACRARLELDEGRWDDADGTAESVLRDPRTWPVPRVFALSVLGLVRARRGERDPWTPLDEAWELAAPTGELQRIGPAATARAEAAWLEQDAAAVVAVTDPALELARRRNVPWVIGELACWRRRAGVDEEVVPAALPAVFELSLRGDAEDAAVRWLEHGCPYEAAVERAHAADVEALQRSLSELQRLGADAAAARVARRLRERGVRGLPRGPRRTTRENPALLTRRELDVLALLAEGLQNAEIAERLVVSRRTIDHHVSSILRKLDVSSRALAVREGTRLGVITDERPR